VRGGALDLLLWTRYPLFPLIFIEIYWGDETTGSNYIYSIFCRHLLPGLRETGEI
jgi:hypothetical protein